MTAPALARLLEQRRAALESLPGVIGTAVGAGDGDGEPAIHLYVTRIAPADEVRSEAAKLLDGAPLELIEMQMPDAQPD